MSENAESPFRGPQHENKPEDKSSSPVTTNRVESTVRRLLRELRERRIERGSLLVRCRCSRCGRVQKQWMVSRDPDRWPEHLRRKIDPVVIARLNRELKDGTP